MDWLEIPTCALLFHQLFISVLCHWTWGREAWAVWAAKDCLGICKYKVPYSGALGAPGKLRTKPAAGVQGCHHSTTPPDSPDSPDLAANLRHSTPLHYYWHCPPYNTYKQHLPYCLLDCSHQIFRDQLKRNMLQSCLHNSPLAVPARLLKKLAVS